jgi:hypothetical protein
MRFALVTTCHLAGWEQYGRRMVETFDQFWPPDFPFYLYAEDFKPDHSRPIVRALPAWLTKFKARQANNPAAHGMIDDKYDFRLDCVRFSHKVGAITDAASRLDVDILIVADADIVTHAPVDTDWLSSLFPPGPYVAWLEREHQYFEGGFYMLRCNHPAHRRIMTRWQGLYESDAVLGLSQTHDAESFQRVIFEAERDELLTTHSLSGEARGHEHPLVNGPLGARLDHLKGPRKTLGKSHASDLIQPRSEAYWCNR